MLEEIGEEESAIILSDFSCPLDLDIEIFAHKKAIGFEKAGISRTHLVFAIVKGKSEFVGLYALSHKPLFFDEKLSKIERKKFYGTNFSISSGIVCDPILTNNERYINSILIGQLSKNYTNGNNKYITGDILINLAFSRVIEWYKICGGVTIHLDCQNITGLKKFYERHGLQYYRKRETKENVFLIYIAPIKSLITSANKLNKVSVEERSIERLRKANFQGAIKKDRKGNIRKPTV